MKAFILRAVLFFSLVFILASAVDWLFCKTILRSKFSAYGVWGDLIDKRVPNIDMAIMGSSRAWTMFNPKTLEDSLGGVVYNYGVDGYAFHMQHLFFRQLMRLNYQPKYILNELDIQTLHIRKDLCNPEHFLGVLPQPHVRDYTSWYKGFDLYERYLPLIRWSGRSMALNIIQKILSRTEAEQDGYDRYHGYLSNSDEWHADADQEFQVEPLVQHWHKPTVALFQDYIRECAEKKIKLIWVLPPMYKELHRITQNQEVIFGHYRRLAKENHILLLDYTNDTLSNSKQYFYNAGHLNTRGAELFSKHLASDLKAAGIRLR